MCTEVYTLFEQCKHKEYQNTCPCSKANRCGAGEDRLLEKPVFLPTKPPSIPPGLFGCKVRKATRPVSGSCRACRRREQMTQSDSNSDSTMRSSASGSSTNSMASRFFTPTSQSYRALAQVQDSFAQVSRQQQLTPPSIGRHRGRVGTNF